jgi:hypothetical protein
MNKSQRFINIAGQLSAVRTALRNEPNPNTNKEVGRATSLTLTKVEEAIFWLGQAINAQLSEETRGVNPDSTALIGQ